MHLMVIKINNVLQDAENVIIPRTEKQKKQNFETVIEETFHNASNNGVVTKDKFNEALVCLEMFQIKRLRDTPLGERLFVVFDMFSKGLMNLIQNKESRIMYTFKAFDKENDNFISRKEFIEFFEDSWKAAFRLLGELVQKHSMKYNNVKIAQVNNWANSHIKELRQMVDGMFSSLDRSRRGLLDYSIFKEWIVNTDFTSIIAQFDELKVEIPINLYKIEVD